jgi:hypothetical protein
MMLARSAHRFSGAARWIAAGGAALYLGVAVCNGLDRAAFYHPEIAPMVPRFAASRALIIQGANALRQQRYDDALEIGKTAVSRTPIDPAASELIGAGLLAKGDQNGARAAFLTSAAMGWRAPVTQTYWMSEAWRVGDYGVAGLRLDALLRENPRLQASATFMLPVEQDPAMRAALIDRMKLQPDWSGPYVSEVAQLDNAQILSRTTVLREMGARGMVVGCAAVSKLVNRLTGMDHLIDGYQLWVQHCPQARGLIGDPGFANIGAEKWISTRFSWQVLNSGSVSVMPGSDDPTTLVLGNSGPVDAAFLRQTLMAPQGRYRLEWIARMANGRPSPVISALVGCDEGNLKDAPTATSEGAGAGPRR